MNAVAADLWPGSLAASVLGALWAWALALVLGATLLERLERGAKPLPPTARLLGWAVTGVPLQAAAWLALGALGGLRPRPLLAVAVLLSLVSAAAAGRPVLAALRELAGSREQARALVRQPLAVVSLLALGTLLAVTARLAIVPTAYYDDLVYHLGLPRQALLTGAWPYLERFHYSAFPAGWDATYCLPLALGGGSGPQLQNVIGLALLAVATTRLARRGGGLAASLFAAALALTCPLFASLGALASNDLFVALALVVGLDRALERRGSRPFTTGLVAGAAWAAKYTALPGLVGIGLVTAWVSSGAPARRLRNLLLVGLGALVLAAPWTVRTTALTGNPVYPAFHAVFDGDGWSAAASALVTRDSAKGALPERGVAAFGLAAVDLVRRGDRLGFPSGLDPAYLALVGLGLLLVARRVRDWPALLVASGLAYVGWAATALNQRYAAFLLLALAPFVARLAGEGLHRLRDARGGALLLGLAALLATSAQITRIPGRHALVYGGETATLFDTERADMLGDLFSSAVAGRALGERLPEDARLLLVGNAFLAFAPRAAVASSAYDEPAVGDLLAGATSAEDVTAHARSAGITHVLLDSRELERWSARYELRERLPAGGDRLLEEWLHTLEPVGRWGAVLAWRLPD